MYPRCTSYLKSLVHPSSSIRLSLSSPAHGELSYPRPPVFSPVHTILCSVDCFCKLLWYRVDVKKKKFHIKKSDVETTMWKSFTCSHANTPGFTAIPRGIHFWQFGLDQVSLLLACMHTYIYFTCPHTYFLITPHLLPYKYC